MRLADLRALNVLDSGIDAVRALLARDDIEAELLKLRDALRLRAVRDDRGLGHR